MVSKELDAPGVPASLVFFEPGPGHRIPFRRPRTSRGDGELDQFIGRRDQGVGLTCGDGIDIGSEMAVVRNRNALAKILQGPNLIEAMVSPELRVTTERNTVEQPFALMASELREFPFERRVFELVSQSDCGADD